MNQLKNFAFLLLAFGLAHVSQAEIKVQNGQKVAFLGDSITMYGWNLPGGYVHLVADALESAGVKIEVIPVGIGGNNSNDMAARIDGVIRQKPDWLTLSCGVNDVWMKIVELEPYKANITAIVDKAQAAGIKVMILTATMIYEQDNPKNQKLAAYNDFLRQLAKERNLPVADLNTLCWKALKANPQPQSINFLTVDGVHMNPEGNMVMARGVLEAFGMEPDKIDAFEKKWRTSSDGAGVAGSCTIAGAGSLSLSNFATLQEMARQQRVVPDKITGEIYFQALRTVLKAHERDPNLSIARIQGDLKAEMQATFSQKLKEALQKP